MWIEISFSRTLDHLSILRQEKKKLRLIRDSIEASYMIEDVDILTLHEALDGIDRLLRSVDRRYSFLEDLVIELRKNKQESVSRLDELEGMFNNYLLIEDSEMY